MIALMYLDFYQGEVLLKCISVLIYLEFLFCFGKVRDETRMNDNVSS